jgi:hypothetical protein
MSDHVYVVEMLRYGNRESHSYILGVYSDRKLAEYEAMYHMNMRAGKYSAEIRSEGVDNCHGRGLVCYIGDTYMDDEDLDVAIQSRKDYLKYRKAKYGV